MKKRLVLVDAQCYQDENYAFRGIGRSTISLLAHCPKAIRENFKFVACLNKNLDEMPPSLSAEFDEITYTVPRITDPAIFFNPSPLTHDSSLTASLVESKISYPIAFVHDFIPYDYPGHLNSVNDYLKYSEALELLSQYRLLVCNSNFTAERSRAVLRSTKAEICVSRIGARAEFFNRKRVLPQAEQDFVASVMKPYTGAFISVAGDGPRKNIECAVKALKVVNEKRGTNHALLIVGHYGQESRARISGLYPDHIEFIENISDAVLATLLHQSIACVLPSYVEGYSMPVVEAIAAGGVVLASDCDAHQELISSSYALFPADRWDVLAEKMEKLSEDAKFRKDLIDKQAPFIESLTEKTVSAEFWDRVVARFSDFDRTRTAQVARRTAGHSFGAPKPNVAFITPFPPQRSGVAINTALGLEALSKRATIDVFTHADADKHAHPYIREILPLEAAKASLSHDLVVYVMGNCIYHHGEIYNLATNYRQSDNIMLFDSIMINLQYDLRSREGAARYASRILDRDVPPSEYESWLARPMTCPILGQEEFLENSWRPIVQSSVMKRAMDPIATGEVIWSPHPVLVHYDADELTASSRRAMRQRYRFSDTDLNIVSAGSVSEVKGMYESIMAIRELVDWGYSPQLHFVGGAHPDTRANAERIARDIGVLRHIHFFDYVSDADFRNSLLAADVGLQLRKVPFGQTSGGLADCISAGLPTVANASMAESIDAPAFVQTVPDVLSPILIAKQIATAYEEKDAPRDNSVRADYINSHSAERYAKTFIDLLM